MEIKKRGPKPSPQSHCPICDRFGTLKRGYCGTCYVRLLRNGKLLQIQKPKLPTLLTSYQDEFLTGCLLGDGCLYRRKATHQPYFAVQRSLSDKAYAIWQQKIIEPFVCRSYDGSSLDKRTKKEYQWTKFVTHRSSIFLPYYESWYGTGHKKIPKQIVLSPVCLAVWLCDDGHVRTCGSPWRLQIKLSTHGFDLDDTEFLCAMLCARYKEYFGITIEKGKGIIYSSDSGCRAFLKEVDGCFPDSMLRKAVCWRNKEVRFYDDIPNRSSVGMGAKRKSKNGKRDLQT